MIQVKIYTKGGDMVKRSLGICWGIRDAIKYCLTFLQNLFLLSFRIVTEFSSLNHSLYS
jgi:hypothetical protein